MTKLTDVLTVINDSQETMLRRHPQGYRIIIEMSKLIMDKLRKSIVSS